RDALLRDDGASWRHGAVLLGFAANCKNEGLALLVAVTIVMLVMWGGFSNPPGRAKSPSHILKLWPAYALAGPWLILRAVHGLGSDITGSHAAVRAVSRLRVAPQILAALVQGLYHPSFWIAVL